MQQRYRRRAPEGMVSGEEFIVIISPHRLVGRERDLSLLRTFVAEAAEDGGALLLTGDAGVGKTALLNVVAAEARRGGTRVLRAAGADFEAALSFAGLSQLRGPVLGQLSELEEIDQRALRVSLGLIDGTASEEQAVAIATLRLLTAVAAVEPVLVVVDDVNWLDRASASVLAYVARRVGGTRIALIAAMRTGERTPFERGGLDMYVLEPLSDAEAEDLLQVRFPSLTVHTRGRLAAEAQGNPLALLELPIALNTRGAPGVVLPRVLPLTERLEQLFASRIDHLPASTRDLLLLAVLDGTGDLVVLSPDGDSLDALAPAERARVARMSTTRRAGLPFIIRWSGRRSSSARRVASGGRRTRCWPSDDGTIRSAWLGIWLRRQSSRTSTLPRCFSRSRISISGGVTRWLLSPSYCELQSSARLASDGASGWPRPPTSERPSTAISRTFPSFWSKRAGRIPSTPARSPGRSRALIACSTMTVRSTSRTGCWSQRSKAFLIPATRVTNSYMRRSTTCWGSASSVVARSCSRA
jgi:hypothetical protein